MRRVERRDIRDIFTMAVQRATRVPFATILAARAVRCRSRRRRLHRRARAGTDPALACLRRRASAAARRCCLLMSTRRRRYRAAP